MNKQIFNLLGDIGESPYMTGDSRLNSQYAAIDTAFVQGRFDGCVAACGALVEQLLSDLYLGVTGEEAPPSVILSDIEFWKIIDNKAFCDTAGMLRYACERMEESDESGFKSPAGAARLAKSGLEDVISYTARFLAQQGRKKCLAPEVLKRRDLRGPINRFSESLWKQMDAAGCSDGLSMQPPFMNAALLSFPEREAPVWAEYIARRLRRVGLLSSERTHTLNAEQIVEERVGMTNEFIRRAAAKANGGVLLIERFEAFDLPCAGGSLIDRALKTTLTAAEKYRGSLCIVVSGAEEKTGAALERVGRGGEYFPLVLPFGEISARA